MQFSNRINMAACFVRCCLLNPSIIFRYYFYQHYLLRCFAAALCKEPLFTDSARPIP